MKQEDSDLENETPIKKRRTSGKESEDQTPRVENRVMS